MILDDVQSRNNVSVSGSGTHTLMFAHGFGCDQTMWRFLTPHFEKTHRLVAFDYVGSGKSDPSAFMSETYSTLDGYAQDIVDIGRQLELSRVTLIGHSVSAMTGLIAALKAPDLIRDIVMICPSPCFLNEPPEYFGGFEYDDLRELMSLMDQNYVGWANHLAPLVLGHSGAGFKDELAGSFCSTDPLFAKAFAKATFFSDCRTLLPKVPQRALVLQSSEDALASVSVGEYVAAHKPNASLEIVKGNGHCLHMTHADVIAPLIQTFLDG